MRRLMLICAAVVLCWGRVQAQPAVEPAAPAPTPEVALVRCEQTLATFRVLTEQIAASRQHGELVLADRIRVLEAELAQLRAKPK